MADELRVSLDGVELNAPNGRYGHWEIDNIEGWWGSPEPKTEQSAKQGADGDYVLPVQYEARYPILTGAFVANGPGERWQGMDVLSGLLSRGRAPLVIGADGMETTAMVERAGAVETSLVGGRLIEFQIQVKAADPCRYGQVHSFPTNPDVYKSIYHYGNYAAVPVFTIQGVFASGYRIYGPAGEVFTVTAALNGTDVIDFADGTVTRNGATVLQGAVGQWGVWTVAPGASASFLCQPVSTGSGTITARVKDTYI